MASTQPPAACTLAKCSTSIGVWLTTFSSALWLQTSVSSGATLRSPTTMARSGARRPLVGAARHAGEKVELVGEFVVAVGVGLVASRRHIEIVHGQPCCGTRARPPASPQYAGHGRAGRTGCARRERWAAGTAPPPRDSPSGRRSRHARSRVRGSPHRGNPRREPWSPAGRECPAFWHRAADARAAAGA